MVIVFGNGSHLLLVIVDDTDQFLWAFQSAGTVVRLLHGNINKQRSLDYEKLLDNTHNIPQRRTTLYIYSSPNRINIIG